MLTRNRIAHTSSQNRVYYTRPTDFDTDDLSDYRALFANPCLIFPPNRHKITAKA